MKDHPKFDEYKAIADTFLDMSEVHFEGDISELLESHKSPLLNHLIYRSINWDTWENVLHELIGSPYTDIATLAELYWDSDAKYFLKKELAGEMADHDEIYQSAKLALKNADTSNPMFSFNGAYMVKLLSTEIKELIPPVATLELKGKY